MRLPWPFRRTSPDGGATAASPAAGAMQRVMAPVRHEWRDAGTLRPSFVGDPGIRVQRFPSRIAGSQLPPPILAPLGHARSADGPAGLVSGLARPTLTPAVRSVAGHVDLPLRPGRSSTRVQRTLATEAGTIDLAPVQGPGESTDVTSAAAAAVTSPTDIPSGMDSVDRLPAIEPRRVPVAATPAPPRAASLTIARTPDLTLASARARATDTPVVERPGGSDALAAPVAVPGAAPGAPTRTILRTSSGSRVRLGPPIERSELAAGLPPLGLAHRAPRSRGETSPAVQRHTTSGEEHPGTPTAGDAAADAPLAGGLGLTIEDEPMGSTAGPVTIAPLVPGGLVLARVVAEPDRASAPGVVAPDEPPAPARPAPLAPLVGSTPVTPLTQLRPTIPQPRTAPASAPAAGGPTRSGGAATAARSTIQRSSAGAVSSSSAHVMRRAVPTDDEGTARTPAPSTAALGSSIALVAGSGAPRPSTAELVLGRSAPAVASANDRHAPTTLTTSPPVPGPGPMPVARPVTLLRDAADVGSVDDDTVSESVRPAASTETPGATPTRVASSTSAGPGTAEGVGASLGERELDEMVRRLYPRLRRSLSTELLVARERAGMLADLR